ncbi:hypothetical protein K458DRAFT_40920 [Lentithecium fluviatile CBS 122367]|uniref:Uncharacterized protein n=1 Tax=Lentithecium fluviatile CBS 122367 TaxID=1168545 RepID=A0A6G1J0C9_9PLEO|nr:hypothetical protein K458DRAFT_40920 [Lentithecium fluviatile CBS 122367]
MLSDARGPMVQNGFQGAAKLMWQRLPQLPLANPPRETYTPQQIGRRQFLLNELADRQRLVEAGLTEVSRGETFSLPSSWILESCEGATKWSEISSYHSALVQSGLYLSELASKVAGPRERAQKQHQASRAAVDQPMSVSESCLQAYRNVREKKPKLNMRINEDMQSAEKAAKRE